MTASVNTPGMDLDPRVVELWSVIIDAVERGDEGAAAAARDELLRLQPVPKERPVERRERSATDA